MIDFFYDVLLGDADNYAVWICGGHPNNPEWNTQEPDLSQCVSDWIKGLEAEVDRIEIFASSPRN